MTDNEKRAHDLAMLYLSEQFKSGEIRTQIDDKYIDYVCCYTDAYLTILDRLNQDLPEL